MTDPPEENNRVGDKAEMVMHKSSDFFFLQHSRCTNGGVFFVSPFEGAFCSTKKGKLSGKRRSKEKVFEKIDVPEWTPSRRLHLSRGPGEHCNTKTSLGRRAAVSRLGSAVRDFHPLRGCTLGTNGGLGGKAACSVRVRQMRKSKQNNKFNILTANSIKGCTMNSIVLEN